ncbi:MAG: WD40 repeat domain-containing protein [Anaerolineae bacterium]|nr:WD40 repeat domain-containing protein [Anaerolineae bacterium]
MHLPIRLSTLILTLMLIASSVIISPPTATSQSGPVELQSDTLLGRGWIHELVWTPDSQHLLVVSSNALSIYTVGAWDTPQIIEPASPALVDAALSPDGTQIALLENGLVRILSTADWSEIRRIETATYDTYDATGTSLGWVGDYLIVYDASMVGFNVWDSRTGALFSTMASLSGRTILNTTPLLTYDIENEWVTYALLTPDQLRLPDEEGMPIFPDGYGEPFAEDEKIFGVAMTPTDPARLVIGVQNDTGEYRVVEPNTDVEPILHIAPPLQELALAPDGQFAALGVCIAVNQNACGGYEIRAVDLVSGITLPYRGRLPGKVGAIRYAPSGEFLAATNGQAVRIWNTADQTQVALLHGFSYSVAQMMTTGNRLVAASVVDGIGSSGVTIWNLGTRQSVAYVPCTGPIDVHDDLLLCGNQLWSLAGDTPTLVRDYFAVYDVYGVAFDPTGTWLAIAYDKGRHVGLWRIDDYEPSAKIVYDAIPNWIHTLEFSADGQYLLTIPGDESIMVWDRAKLQTMGDPLVLTQPDPNRYTPDLNVPPFVTQLGGSVKAMAINPGDGSLVVDQYIGQIQVFDDLTERYSVSLFDWVDSLFPHALAVSQDGQWMAAGGCYLAPHGGWCSESRVYGYDAATGEHVWSIVRTEDRIISLAFSQDGQWVMGGTAHLDKTIHARLIASGGIHVWALPGA